MKSPILKRLYMILVVTAVAPLTVAVFEAMNTFERWSEAEYHQDLAKHQTIFRTLLIDRQDQLQDRMSRFTERRDVAKALKSADRTELLTLAISAVEPTGWEAFYLVSADRGLLIDPITMRRGDHDPRFAVHIDRALSNQRPVSLAYDPGLGVGIMAAIPIHDLGGGLIGAVAVFDPLAKAWLDGLKAMTKFDFALISGDRRTVASTWLPAGSAVPALQTLQTQAAEETDRPARLTIDGSEYFALQVPLTDMHGVVVAQVLITRSSADFRAVLKEFKLDFGALALGFLLSRMLTGKLNQEMAQRVEAEERSQNSLARLTRQGGQIVFVQDLARIANEARNFHQAIDATLDRICEFSGWHLAHAYLPEGDDLSVMQPSGIWVVKGPDREQFLPFMERTGQGRLRAGEGLFDSILENGQTVLIADVGQCQEFSRRAAAAACGLHGGFALGIKAGGQVVGILEFYSTHVGLPPEDLQASLSDIGVQLGRVAEREIILDRLELAASEAVSANQAKSVFLANMSHELRTPLNAIIGFSELIKSEVFGPVGAPQYTDYINDIHESGGHLLSVINDVLDMSKIEAGQLEPLFIDVDMAGIAETCMSFSSGGPLMARSTWKAASGTICRRSLPTRG